MPPGTDKNFYYNTQMVQYINIHGKCDKANLGSSGQMLVAKNLSSNLILIFFPLTDMKQAIFFKGARNLGQQRPKHNTIVQQIINF